MAADSCPPERVAAVERVGDERVGPEFEQGYDGSALPCLGGEVDGGDPLAVVRAAEGAAAVRVGAELDERAHGLDSAVDRGPAQRGAAVGVGVGLGAKVDQEPDRVDPVGLRCPHERLVEYLLMAVGGLPGGEAAVGAVEAAMRASLGRADERADQVEIAETGGDPEVPRSVPSSPATSR